MTDLDDYESDEIPPVLAEWLAEILSSDAFVSMMDEADEMYGEDNWTIAIDSDGDDENITFRCIPDTTEE